jgi:DNA ligase-1
MKPQLAEDAILDKVIFPCVFQPKIDGVRAWNPHGQLVGRSMDPFKGFGITEYWSQPEFQGFDGEMVLGDKPNSTERLCSLTSGAMGAFKDVKVMADLTWWLFDLVTPSTIPMAYKDRYAELAESIGWLAHPRLRLVPSTWCEDREQLDILIETAFNNDYEGGIIRNPFAPYKEGRADKRQQLWRVKPWQDDEILVTGITEGDRNENEAKLNTLGRTERSSAKAGKVPNGLVGTLEGTLIKDIHSNITGKLLFPQGLPVSISAGALKAPERKHYFENQHEIIGRIAKFQHMAHGTKDKPRMGGFLSLRLPQDIST